MTDRAIVLFGDVVDSRLDGPGSSAWLRSLAAELDDVYGRAKLARFGFTQGDELQGVIRPDADPLAALFRASLRDGVVPAMRWVIAAGTVEAGKGPATQRTGEAFLAARELAALARRRRDRLLVRSGDPETDALLDDIAPLLGVLLDELTDRQRRIGQLLIVDGLRQSEVAVRLGIRRPTVSVAAERAHIRDIQRLANAIGRLLRDGQQRVLEAAGIDDRPRLKVAGAAR